MGPGSAPGVTISWIPAFRRNDAFIKRTPMHLKWLQRYNLLVFEEIDSTNNEAKRLIKAGALDRLVIWTKNQTDGRGRHGKQWESLDGNLYISILSPIQCELYKAAELSFVLGLAVSDVIEYLAEKSKIKPQISLKWPNDIMLNGAKIGGILLESLPEEDDRWVIIGLGLNIEEAPKSSVGSSLKSIGIRVSAGQVLDLVMNRFDYYHNMWSIYGFTKIRQIWLKGAYKLGEVVTISDVTNRVSGVFETIEKDGSIRIKLASGEKYSMSTGEIFFG